MQIAVGGCLAQKDRGEITRRAPWVDVVFGTHNIGSLPTLLERARVEEAAQVEIAESLERFPSTLPTRRDSAYAAWVSVSVGCNNTCTFCIVPSLRGREEDRRPGDILAEIEMLVAEGVQEVTLLGQNVNAYGVEFGDRGRVRQAAAGLRAGRGPRAGPLHLAAPARLHPRRHRGDGRDAERHAPAAHAAAVRLGPRAAGDAPLLPQRQVPADHRRRPRRAAARRDHHRHHRRLPRRDRGGLPGHARRRRGLPLRGGVHVPVLDPPGHPGRDDAGPGAARGRAGALRAARRRRRGRRLGGEPRPGRPHRRGDVRRRRGPQGRRHRADVGPGARQPAGPRPRARGPGRSSPVRATSPTSSSPTPPRTTSPPTTACSPCGVRAAATPGRPGRPARPRPAPSSASGCPPSASRPRWLPRPPAAEPSGWHPAAMPDDWSWFWAGEGGRDRLLREELEGLQATRVRVLGPVRPAEQPAAHAAGLDRVAAAGAVDRLRRLRGAGGRPRAARRLPRHQRRPAGRPQGADVAGPGRRARAASTAARSTTGWSTPRTRWSRWPPARAAGGAPAGGRSRGGEARSTRRSWSPRSAGSGTGTASPRGSRRCSSRTVRWPRRRCCCGAPPCTGCSATCSTPSASGGGATST